MYGYISSSPLCIGYDSSGGYLFFLKIFVESKRGELSKTENKLLTGKEQTSYNLGGGLRPITTGLFQNGQTGGGCGHGVGYCLLSLVSRMICCCYATRKKIIYFLLKHTAS